MRWQYTLCLLLEAATVLGQTAVPTNATLPPGLENPAELLFSLSQGSTGYGPAYGIDYAQDASRGKWNGFIAVETNQTITLTTPFTVSALTNNSIAYITCDPANYTQSNLSLQQLIIQATAKIAPSSYMYGAIILYTTTANWCNYTTDATYSYPNVFVLPNATQALAVEKALSSASTGSQIASIFSNSTTTSGSQGSGNSNSSDSSGNIMGPSTTVAMIILYSVTGVITLCFVVVIITGALRARRHPERYGLLNLPGNAHQRRARGIARAMLDTIPIVKFGGQEPMKVSHDVEQGAEMQQLPEAKEQSLDSTRTPAAGADASAAVAGATTSEESSTANASHAEQAAAEILGSDNGLACSVCTEDFVKGQDLRVLPCNHKFHPECIDPWLLNVSGTCPLCRIDLRPPGEQEEERAAQEAATAAAAAANAAGTNTTSGRLPRFSTYVQYRQMREATPAQRLGMLRDLRNLRRGNDNVPPVPTNRSGNATPTTSTAEATPTHSNRVSRFFRRRDGSPPEEGSAS